MCFLSAAAAILSFVDVMTRGTQAAPPSLEEIGRVCYDACLRACEEVRHVANWQEMDRQVGLAQEHFMRAMSYVHDKVEFTKALRKTCDACLSARNAIAVLQLGELVFYKPNAYVIVSILELWCVRTLAQLDPKHRQYLADLTDRVRARFTA
eukprot:CAMPEP_0181502068 /NCGR_PEP_ID=MMETSP1110-20121109/56148_1 /TAXON_ID=174948 /ORGANISM="Symbiodinium sp., Strain CCMP421" /LENGTH=151 /DNA_ID=CAMNT_0023630603 /DNA_START=1 /DNA_END=452 /DNA_ORIENTATION=+